MTYKMGSDLSFEKCLPFTLIEEGGYSNDPHDPGGKTMEGILQREYDKYRRKIGLPLQWVKLISDEEMHDIYYNEYWLPHCPMLAPGLNLSFFDQCVNEGPREAILLLQRAMAIHADGIWGNETENAVKRANLTPGTIIQNYTNDRMRFYRSLKNYRYFGHDWIHRSTTIEKHSLAMIGATGATA